jgi:hypothetical protein
MNPDSDPEIPPDLADLDRRLRRLRFDPRPSLGPEILGRVRRGEIPPAPPRWPHRRELAAGIAAVLALALGGGMLAHTDSRVLVDRCCYDFDGGGVPDDGVILLAERDAAVERLRIYEDLDGSRTFSPGDLVRLDRGPQPAIEDDLTPTLVTTRHCCLDFDGGGPPDDALLVIGVPPDRVMMAAIYERSAVPRPLRLR